jgi:type II secretory pathway pseudopilin PulG
MKVRGGRKSQQAGTLIEVVLATVILSILGAGIMGSVNYGLFSMRCTRENQRATQVMLEKTEALRLYDWDQVTSNGFIPTNFLAYYDPQNPNTPGVVYNGTLAVLPAQFGGYTPSYSTNMRQVVVTVTWVTMGTINHTRSLTTYVAKDGIQNYVY